MATEKKYALPDMYSTEVSSPVDVPQRYPGGAIPSTNRGAPEWAAGTKQGVEKMVGRYPRMAEFPTSQPTTATAAVTESAVRPDVRASAMGPSLAGITTQRPFMTSDEEFKRLGGFSQADKEIINARIRERQAAQAGISEAIGPGMARTTDAQGRTTYTGVGGAIDQDAEMRSRGMVHDPYGNWMPPGGWGAGGEYSSGAQTPSEEPDIGSMTIPQLMAYGVKNKRAARAQEQAGALGRIDREAALRGQAAGDERTYNAPERAVRIGEGQAKTESLRLGMADKQRMEALHEAAKDVNRPLEERKKAAAELGRKQKELFDQQALLARLRGNPEYGMDAVESHAAGGIVRGYADGGAVGRDLAQPAPPVNPLIAQYGQYLTAAASAGAPPVPFSQYQNLLQTTRDAAQGQPPVGFADGGDVSALGRPLEGPGTGTSDSIPAMIDGVKPAALSKDEFVFPAEVTKYYGTKFMNDLIAKAKAALSGEGAVANG